MPRPRAAGEAATRTALTRLSGPSPESAEAGRIAPVMTVAASAGRTRCRSQAVSSRVFVPCVTTTPSTPSSVRAGSGRRRPGRRGRRPSWRGRGRGGTGPRATCAMVASSGAIPASSSPGASRVALSRYAARSRRSVPSGVDGAAGRDDGDARQAHEAAGEAGAGRGTAPGSQCGAAAGGVNRATRSISRRIRSPSTGPSAYSGIGRSQTADPSDTASAPAQKYSRQSSKSRMPPLAMIGRRKPGVAQLRDHPQADRLDRPPAHRPVAVLEVRLAGVGAEAQALDGVDRGDRRAAVGRRRGSPASGSPRPG